MRKRIQKSMILVIVTTLAIAYAITIFFVYERVRTLAEKDVRYECSYISAAANISGERYLKQLDEVEPGTRVTLIAPNGDVLYDTGENAETLENHSNRPEVKEALKSGYGQASRRSDTLNEDLFYAAQRLDDGNVLRISKPVKTVFFTALELLPVMIAIGAAMLVLAIFISSRQARKLVDPINHLDLDNPLENDIYEELRPLLQRIDEQNKAKDSIANMRKEFSANVSHELKTPLTSISGYAEIIRDGIVKPDDIPQFSDRIYKEANRLVALINDTIKISELDEGEVTDAMETVDLYEVAKEVVNRLGGKTRENNIRVTLTGESCKVQGICRLLDEMIYNITENAIKYNRPGGRVSVWVGRDVSGPKVVVSDTGIGIPEDQQERIFERFYRVDKSRSKERGGTGLGLSIVKHGAEIHHAKIEVRSKVGEGTTMAILFPEK